MTTKSLSSGGSHIQISAPYSSSLGSNASERELKVFATEIKLPAALKEKSLIMYQLGAAKILIKLLHDTLHGLFEGKLLTNINNVFAERIQSLQHEETKFDLKLDPVKTEHEGVVSYVEELGGLIKLLSDPQERMRTNFGKAAPNRHAGGIKSIPEDNSEYDSSHSSSQQSVSLRGALIKKYMEDINTGKYPEEVQDMMKMIEETIQLSVPRRIVNSEVNIQPSPRSELSAKSIEGPTVGEFNKEVKPIVKPKKVPMTNLINMLHDASRQIEIGIPSIQQTPSSAKPAEGQPRLETNISTMITRAPEVSNSPRKRESVQQDDFRGPSEVNGLDDVIEVSKEVSRCIKNGSFAVSEECDDVLLGRSKVSLVQVLGDIRQGLIQENHPNKSIGSEVIEHESQLSLEAAKSEPEKPLHHRHQSEGFPSEVKPMNQVLIERPSVMLHVGVQTEEFQPKLFTQGTLSTTIIPQNKAQDRNQKVLQEVMTQNLSRIGDMVHEPLIFQRTLTTSWVPKAPRPIETIKFQNASFHLTSILPNIKPPKEPVMMPCKPSLKSVAITTESQALDLSNHVCSVSILAQANINSISNRPQQTADAQTSPEVSPPESPRTTTTQALHVLVPHLDTGVFGPISIKAVQKPQTRSVGSGNWPELELQADWANSKGASPPSIHQTHTKRSVEEVNVGLDGTPIKHEASTQAISKFSEGKLDTFETPHANLNTHSLSNLFKYEPSRTKGFSIQSLPTLSANTSPRVPVDELKIDLEALLTHLTQESLFKSHHFSVTGSLDQFVSEKRQTIQTLIDSLPLLNQILTSNLRRSFTKCGDLLRGQKRPLQENLIPDDQPQVEIVNHPKSSMAMIEVKQTGVGKTQPKPPVPSNPPVISQDLPSIFWDITRLISEESVSFAWLLSSVLKHDYIFSQEKDALKKIVQHSVANITSFSNYVFLQKQKMLSDSVLTRLQQNPSRGIERERVEELRVFLAYIKQFTATRGKLEREAKDILEKKFLKTGK